MLEVPGAIDITVEFTSMSKTYSMPGWRVGFAVGNERADRGAGRVKSYLDYGAFTPIQVAAAAALNGTDDCIKEVRDIYRTRRDVMVESFGRAGWNVPSPKATMFVWSPIPDQYAHLGSLEFAKLLIQETGVAVAPGVGFGEYGEGMCAWRWSRTSSASARPPATSAASSTPRRNSFTTSSRSPRGARSMARPLKVGVAGLGTVGAALVAPDRAPARARWPRVAGAPSRSSRSARARATKNRGVDLKKMKWFSDPVALARSGEHRCICRTDRRRRRSGEGRGRSRARVGQIGGDRQQGAARQARRQAGGAGREKHDVALNFEAAVGAAIPIVKTLREGLAGNQIDRIYGILNGTCNYILTRMEQERLSFADCLKEAQQLGYAEADPAFDIEGHDTAQKLAILGIARLRHQSRSARDLRRRHILDCAGRSRRPPTNSAIASSFSASRCARRKGIEQRVHPTMVRKDSSIAQVMGVTNAVTIDAEASIR